MTMKSDLGEKLLPASLSGSEQLGHLFSYQLKMWSEVDDIDLRSLLGSSITVTYEEEDYKRKFNGIVADVSQGGVGSFQGKRYSEYMATLVPKPWLLLHKVDCRIYLNQSVPEIVKTVLGEIGYSDVKQSLSGNYPKREYCVQYREDYFNFISRLMEQEGIYYFFQHSDGVHTMVLADSLGAHSATPGFATLPYLPETAADTGQHETAITEFSAARSVQTVKYSLTDYDPLKPRTKLLGSSTIDNADENHSVSGLESFDYPGAHVTSAVGEHYAQVRIEAINAAQSEVSGTTSASGLLTGALFTLEGFPRSSLNKEYLVVGSTVQIENPEHGSDATGPREEVCCSFTAIRSQQPFRTMPTAEKPVIVGVQTAIVTGSKTDEDIAVDKYGRIQVNFHWNMPDKKNAHCSCFARVASSWAGKNWGAVNIPRVGQEVVVSFIEGDPDRPLIVGSVYNADNMPPYSLPGNKTQSGVKSRSLLGGDADFNELRFEDKKGEEDFFIHAQKDMHEEVENDHTVTIDHDEIITIKNDQTAEIKHDRTHTIDNDDKLTVKNDQTVTIQNNRTHKVDQEEKLTVGANSTHDITQKFKLDAGTEIQLVCGMSSITMKASGEIEIKGSTIKINGMQKIEAVGMMGVKVEGMKVELEAMTTAKMVGALSAAVESGVSTKVLGGAQVGITGAIIKLT
ncbi:MAG TPA: type VI secretion system tip protein TssI/VgrG [Rhodanobacteraceae bacterium]|nr:type VI secretion system tip protein TssI/VgrG [Rhodanobacteraceae bacterium]